MLSNIAQCVVAKNYVLTDETQQECSTEHNCPNGTKCPLDGCFREEGEYEHLVEEVKAKKLERENQNLIEKAQEMFLSNNKF